MNNGTLMCATNANMRVKLKYALPLVQMALALALRVSSQLWYRAMGRIQDMPGPFPPSQLLVSVNAPVALPLSFLYRHMIGWYDAAFFAAIGALWYWVALNICSWRERRVVCMFTWKPLRLMGDLVLVGVGMVWAFVCTHEVLHGYWPHTPFGWLWDGVCMGFVLAWSLALMFFFGRDLIHCLLRKEPLTGRAAHAWNPSP
jgi:hypothetical protein